ncbi:MAG: hypothetical protein M0R33_15260 [Methylomonas sp.]|jgi:hypothetical protein|uniref:hypothetical protein n=1 Tax=Methylomonas sp. TaxID=418 RepID=UPI002600C7D5|nr:hypothetical protein [Methylomonas sp.]MCK9607800.1 hypothetical protein [Methylomonas sp.]
MSELSLQLPQGLDKERALSGELQAHYISIVRTNPQLAVKKHASRVQHIRSFGARLYEDMMCELVESGYAYTIAVKIAEEFVYAFYNARIGCFEKSPVAAAMKAAMDEIKKEENTTVVSAAKKQSLAKLYGNPQPMPGFRKIAKKN